MNLVDIVEDKIVDFFFFSFLAYFCCAIIEINLFDDLKRI